MAFGFLSIMVLHWMKKAMSRFKITVSFDSTICNNGLSLHLAIVWRNEQSPASVIIPHAALKMGFRSFSQLLPKVRVAKNFQSYPDLVRMFAKHNTDRYN